MQWKLREQAGSLLPSCCLPGFFKEAACSRRDLFGLLHNKIKYSKAASQAIQVKLLPWFGFGVLHALLKPQLALTLGSGRPKGQSIRTSPPGLTETHPKQWSPQDFTSSGSSVASHEMSLVFSIYFLLQVRRNSWCWLVSPSREDSTSPRNEWSHHDSPQNLIVYWEQWRWCGCYSLLYCYCPIN